MAQNSLRSLTAGHLLAGDTRERRAERVALMAANERRAASVVRFATDLHEQLGRMTLSEAGANGSATGSPRMIVRNLGDKLYGLAHKWHCHAGIYRTFETHALLQNGGLSLDGHAVVHCEHTIPSSLMVGLMWHMRRDGEFPTPASLLMWLLSHSVVTIALQTERNAKGAEPVALGRKRLIGSREHCWVSTHPELTAEGPMSDSARPFLRYQGTGARIIHAPSEKEIAIATFTMADHKELVSDCQLHRVETYFP